LEEADIYKTIEKPSEGIYKNKGSRFLAFSFPIFTEAEVKENLAVLRKRYHDARHHCYAYILGAEKTIYRINDDGEPSGTAGRPIYGQIQSAGLTNILIVVFRYFGGTLLGVRGLIDAYKSAAADALSNAAIVTRYINDIYEISFDYPFMQMINKLLKDHTAEVISYNNGLKASLTFRIRKKLSEKICKLLTINEVHSVTWIKTE